MNLWVSVLIVLVFRISDIESGKLDCEVNPHEVVQPFTIKFYFCSREIEYCELVETESMELNNSSLKSEFDTSVKTTILIHGFMRNPEDPWIQKLKSALLDQEPMNIILVDWSAAYEPGLMETLIPSLKPFLYTKAVKSIPRVAKKISDFLQNVSLTIGTPLNQWHKLHFIGHSLGAHTAGRTAKKLKDVVDVARITGLDPARPCFESENIWLKLNRTDAKFVDVIHTNSEPGEKVTFGTFEPIGNIDFYPNGGNNQPGCSEGTGIKKNYVEPTLRQFKPLNYGIASFVNSIHNLWNEPADYTDLIEAMLERGSEILCNHDKASEYFIRSLNMTGKRLFAVPLTLERSDTEGYDLDLARNVGKCVEFGYYADESGDVQGTYYVDTESVSSQCDELDTENVVDIDKDPNPSSIILEKNTAIDNP